MTTLLRSRLSGKGVYAITDGPRDDLFAAVEAALAGGARLLQYRDKTTDAERRRAEADELSRICARYGVPFIVNDDVALARETGGGVHLGYPDGSIAEARAQLGPDAIIGVSCYGSIERARQLQAEGADYLGFGAMYASTTKRHATVVSHDVVTQAKALGLPIVAIGGITPDNAQAVIDAGADYLAVVSAIFSASDIQTATRRLADLFDPRPGIIR
ncbi:thiamine phosphate synthase [Luteibacter sp. UNCMF366Tsu5.1]|uniref:thiamine phosphate synthase n=1 Tax=Luteibacter sp. UNCMF366Tsu5.1 TaxID=1502758 RepID=UPI000908A405|nr:thiamine phosphate synthase [Luteibacter sp. UNCMF366Tsu5.1]SFW73328.1 thiamine-phosphate pyrophosphorylase [Luteibacter sp. UNCMF366Tsu5.1]